MRRKKDCKVYTDSDFPNYIFCKFGNELKVFSEVSYYNSKQRDIDHYWLKPKNWNGKTRKAISVQRIEAAMEIERDVLDVRYVPKNKTYRVKKNAILLGLIKAKKELTEEHPNLPIDEYIDDAYIRIINTGYIPTDYQDIKEVILKNIVAVKIEREHRRVSVDKVDYKLTDHEDDI